MMAARATVENETQFAKADSLPIYAVTPFTMLDFPEKTACIVWFPGCNMRCAYCHNPQIVEGKGRGHVDQVMAFLKKRQGLLDGVVLSGGEASVYPGLPALIRQVKALDYAVKLDTNGLRPDVVLQFIQEGFLDYVALDYKAPPHKFKQVTGTNLYALFSQTLDILCTQKAVKFEVRTTVHTDLLNEDDVNFIIQDLERRGYTGTHAIQNFMHSDERPTLKLMHPQRRILDTSFLYQPKKFHVIFRNFPQ